MENQAVKPTVSAGNLQGYCQNEPEAGAEDMHPNGPWEGKRASENPSPKRTTIQSQIDTRSKPEDIALRTKSPLASRGPAPKLVLGKNGEIDFKASSTSLQRAFGTSDSGLAIKLLTELVGTIPRLKSIDANEINPEIAAIHEIGPRDALEAMLAVQMIGLHNVAMQRLERANESVSLGEDSHVNAATKLLRVFTALMEALDRHRGKGDPRMVVEHLHVEKGAQAVVGPVSHQSSGDSSEDYHGKPQ